MASQSETHELLARADEIAPGTCKLGYFEGKQVAIFNLDGKLYATQAECPHRGGPLCEGAIRGDTVTCPWHRLEFNIRTGKLVTGLPFVPLRTYGVSVEGGVIVINKEE
jgi:3-phenylpropionate/trans-cinnamate dioxygenase ferredoxin subunit